MAFQKPTRRRKCRGTCRGHSASHVLAGRRSYERRCQWWSEVSGRGSAPILLATPRESGPDILTRGWNDVTPAFPPDRASSADHLAGRTSCWNNETQDHRLRRHQSAPTRTNSSDRRDSRDGATRRADDPGPSTNVGYIHRREKRYDSTAAAAADTGIRPATPQRMRHNPRRPPGARRHHRDCDLPRRIRPAGLDLQLTMAAPTVGGARLLAADPPGGDVIPGQ
jgi:hypothetical protein